MPALQTAAEYGLSVLFLALIFQAPSLCQVSQTGLRVSCDTDCIVAIDQKAVGTLGPGRQNVFPLTPGKHTIAGAGREGAYWETQISFDGYSLVDVVIPLVKAATERAQLQAEVQVLQSKVGKDQQQLAEAQKRNDILARNPNLVQDLRRQLAAAIWEYQARESDEWQRSNAHKAEGDGYAGLGTPGTPAGLAGTWSSGNAYQQAIKNAEAANAAIRKISELMAVFQDPIARTKDLGAPDYRSITDTVENGRHLYVLTMAPGQVKYEHFSGRARKPVRTTVLSCSEIKEVRTSGLPIVRSIAWMAGSGSLTIVTSTTNLKLDAGDQDRSDAITGDIYLVCPGLTPR